MAQAWMVMGETYLLTIVVSLLIRRFGAAAKPLPASAEQVEVSAAPDDPDELAALAIAVAVRRNNGEGR